VKFNPLNTETRENISLRRYLLDSRVDNILRGAGRRGGRRKPVRRPWVQSGFLTNPVAYPNMEA
jgi:hypothetical protein